MGLNICWGPEPVDATILRPLAPTDVLRRIEVIRTTSDDKESIVGCGRFCDNTALPMPWPETYKKPDVFWFTEDGWSEYGRVILRNMSYPGVLKPNERVIVRDRLAEMIGGESLSYEDRFQVAIRKPAAPRKRRAPKPTA
jgi:hypothetical protein